MSACSFTFRVSGSHYNSEFFNEFAREASLTYPNFEDSTQLNKNNTFFAYSFSCKPFHAK